MDDRHTESNSLKLNVKGSGAINGGAAELKQEFYKPIPEDNLLPPVVDHINNNNKEKESAKDTEVSNDVAKTNLKTTPDTTLNGGDKTMVQEENTVHDGADEQMLGADDNDKLAEKRDEVKFIRGDHQNGDAKIDIGNVNGKSFTGMSKEELMKYANDPFWIRLRWIFFVGFWAIWAAMLVGAILIIIQAPKCAAPEPLPWYKQGPIAKFQAIEHAGAEDLQLAKKIHATAAIYELPADLTYAVKEPAVEANIKELVAKYKDSDVNVILDITPNYVKKDSQLMQNALADAGKRSAFIWIEQPQVPNNWLSMVNGSAWTEIQPGNYVLSQFDDGLFDLHMNDSIVKQELNDVFAHLLHLGVKGFRLKNTKYFLLNKNLAEESPADNPQYIHTQYGFWTHTQTTFQDGLGDLLYEYLVNVKNISADALLSVADDVVRPEVYQNNAGEYGIDLPIYGRFTNSLSAPKGKNLHDELTQTLSLAGNHTWLQWNYGALDNSSAINPSAYSLFLALLPGVPVVPVDSLAYSDTTDDTYKHIEALRSSASYKYGEFALYESAGDLVVYSRQRIKSGNPGYFVAFNPTNITQTGNFTNLGLPEKMTVDVISDNYNVTDVTVKSKPKIDAIEVSAYATIILTYVPVKSA